MIHLPTVGPIVRLICAVLALAMATASSAAVLAQTYGAQQAVRRRVQGFESPPGETPPTPDPVAPAEALPPAESGAGTFDTTYITPAATAVLALRPAQILSSPLAELLPTEVVTAAGSMYLGVDPATVDHLVAFVDMSNPAGPAYGATVRFNQPFRGAAIPPHARPYVQLAELAGRKYLQSAHPIWPSFYGTNSRTLIVAPDATMRQLIESTGQAKSGPLIDRLRNVPPGHDLYLAVDVASLRPMIQMGLSMAPPQLPAEVKPLLEAPNLIAAAELTFNMSAPGPTSFVLHANDESAAVQLETLLRSMANKTPSPEMEQLAMQSPVGQALENYRQRMSERFGMRREGASVVCFRIDANDPAREHIVSSVVVGMSLLLPAIDAAGKAAEQVRQAQQPQAAEMPATAEPPAEPGP
jgi:hypothetical protein